MAHHGKQLADKIERSRHENPTSPRTFVPGGAKGLSWTVMDAHVRAKALMKARDGVGVGRAGRGNGRQVNTARDGKQYLADGAQVLVPHGAENQVNLGNAPPLDVLSQ